MEKTCHSSLSLWSLSQWLYNAIALSHVAISEFILPVVVVLGAIIYVYLEVVVDIILTFPKLAYLSL